MTPLGKGHDSHIFVKPSHIWVLLSETHVVKVVIVVFVVHHDAITQHSFLFDMLLFVDRDVTLMCLA